MFMVVISSTIIMYYVYHVHKIAVILRSPLEQTEIESTARIHLGIL